MAVVIVLLSCVLGAVAGIFQLAFLGASFGQAFLTYMALSLILSASALGAAVVIAFLRPAKDEKARSYHEEMEAWQDWSAEESMEADIRERSAGGTAGSLADVRHSDSPQILQTSRVADATAYSVRRAGKG